MKSKRGHKGTIRTDKEEDTGETTGETGEIEVNTEETEETGETGGTTREMTGGRETGGGKMRMKMVNYPNP